MLQTCPSFSGKRSRPKMWEEWVDKRWHARKGEKSTRANLANIHSCL